MQDLLFIALLSTTLWAINPIQTQAVTYIVQRMASMAAMFYIFAVYNYIRARQADTTLPRCKHLLYCCLFFLLALGCKENAVTLIPSLLLIEVLFLQRTDRFSKTLFYLLIIANLLFLLAAAYYIHDQNYLKALTDPVGFRPFSTAERLLTQPAILLFYLSLLLYPAPARLSFDHSFPLSTSLLHPWTTLPALLGVAALIVLALWQWRKRPLLSFAILFFFLNHLVESTIIPLELIFEHRNYLPSFFLFLPVAAGLLWAINHARAKSRHLLHGVLITSIPLFLIAIGLGTYSRNQVWATEESLWTDALQKAPDNARPYAKLGEIYGWQKEKNIENLQTAVALLSHSLDLEYPDTTFNAAIVGNIGKVYANYGLLDEAIHYYQQSLNLNPNFITSRFDLANALALQGRFTEALTQIDLVIEKNDLQSRFFNLRSMLLLWLDRPEEAAQSSHGAMVRTFVNKERYFYNTGVALTRAGHLSQGRWFLGRALHRFPNDRHVLYALVENHLLAEDLGAAEQYALQLLGGHGILILKHDMENLHRDYSSVPVNIDLIAPFLLATARDIVKKGEQSETLSSKSDDAER
ncbi:tetratricopeptide repeat protein [Desulfobulbus alkaliphilus]|nr:tetratricopeptide repeat protein [Desulfobulbus alkaliphilus]